MIKVKAELPKGITVRKHKKSESLQICFMYKNRTCREALPIPATPANIKKAFNKRNLILAEIEAKTFEYDKHFPNSPKVKFFSGINKKLTVGDLLNKQIEDYQSMYEKGNLSISTLVGYKKITQSLLKFFGDIYINDLSSNDIKNWLTQLGLNNITVKTIRNRLSILKSVLDEAKNDKLILISPLDEIALSKQLNRVATKSDYVVEPFNDEEKQIIIDTTDGQIKNLIQFNFWTGLRISELIALKWSDIDFENNATNIKRAKVENEIKTTKTKAGIRSILMFPKAREALINQLEYTRDCEFVFHNPNTNQDWANSTKIGEVWKKLLTKANVKYRNPYQMRHTYASTLLSNGENVFWLSTQMGHENTEMIFKHYGKWIPKKDNGGYSPVGKY